VLLLIDNTSTTGGNPQSAAIALREAGAARIAIVVIGRHFDPDFGPNGAYYRRAELGNPRGTRCCLEEADTADERS
jgi:hypothetical protein